MDDRLIAEYLARSSLGEANIDVTPGITKWDSQIYLGMDSNAGDHSSEEENWRSEIKNYVNRFAAIPGLPIQIVDANDSRTNIIVMIKHNRSDQKEGPDDQMDDSVSISGQNRRESAYSILNGVENGFIEPFSGPLLVRWGRITYDYRIRACAIKIVLPNNSQNNTARSIEISLRDPLLWCFGIHPDLIFESYTNAIEVVAKNPFYFIELLYSPEIRPGMRADTASSLYEKRSRSIER